MDKIFVIYKDGKRLEKDQSGRTIKVTYLKKGAANSVITNLINTYLRWELNLSEYYDHERWLQATEKERQRYEIIEYVPFDEVIQLKERLELVREQRDIYKEIIEDYKK